jgi:hypothetical protein
MIILQETPLWQQVELDLQNSEPSSRSFDVRMADILLAVSTENTRMNED